MKIPTGGKPRELEITRTGEIPVATVKSGWKKITKILLFSSLRYGNFFYGGIDMNSSTKFITRVGIFGAVSALVYFIFNRMNLSLTFIGLPNFLSLHFSDVPALIASFAYGPLTGTLVQIIKVIIRTLFTGTNTGFIGEIADMIYGIAFVLPASIIYMKNRTFKGALNGMILTLIIHLIVTSVVNYYVIIPMYVRLYNLPIKVTWEFIFTMILPFNLIKNVLDLIITLLIYKRIHNLIKRASYQKNNNNILRNGH